MLEVWPSRNHLRGDLILADNMRTPTMNPSNDYCREHIRSITKSRLTDERSEMISVRGIYDDTDGFSITLRLSTKQS